MKRIFSISGTSLHNNNDFLTFRTEYLCHGQWQENSTTFIVAKHVGSSHGVCITFKQIIEGQTGNFIVGDSCFRSTLTQLTPSDRHLVSNITSFSKFYTNFL